LKLLKLIDLHLQVELAELFALPLGGTSAKSAHGETKVAFVRGRMSMHAVGSQRNRIRQPEGQGFLSVVFVWPF